VEDRSQGAAGEAALIGRVAGGDLAAFGALYDRYARDVYAFAAHALGRGPAEEVAQDVFVRIWQRAAQFDETRGSVAGWIMAIARHRIVDEIRHRGRSHDTLATIDALLAGAEDPDADVEEATWLHDRRRGLLDAVRELPEEQRRVLVLAYFGGLTQSEIAQKLGCPLGTVKKRTRLGLQKLRASLTDGPFVELLEGEVSERRG
jgi:RNA polymerase sigma-70 factor (ECF subfamily)